MAAVSKDAPPLSTLLHQRGIDAGFRQLGAKATLVVFRHRRPLACETPRAGLTRYPADVSCPANELSASPPIITINPAPRARAS